MTDSSLPNPGTHPPATCPGGCLVSSVTGTEAAKDRERAPLRVEGPPGLTSLEPQETTWGFDQTLAFGLPAPPNGEADPDREDNHRALCSAFRHSGWEVRRRLTATALRAAGMPDARLDRFETCGTLAWVLRDKADHSRVRLAVNQCHDRFCVPCADARRHKVCTNLRTALAGKDLRLLTLTLKSHERPLTETLTNLRDSWRLLRGELAASGRLLGGVTFLELTLNPDTRCWHPHLHVICEGTYINHTWLSQRWLAITKDSYIVDIRHLRGSDAAAGYVSKYASKAISANVLRDEERFIEAILCLRGTRTFQTFGTWTGLDLSRIPDDNADWEALAPLWLIIQRATTGDAEAYAILCKLRRTDNAPSAQLLDLSP